MSSNVNTLICSRLTVNSGQVRWVSQWSQKVIQSLSAEVLTGSPCLIATDIVTVEPPLTRKIEQFSVLELKV